MTNNTPTSKSLLILLWNANGIHNHIAELSLVLHDKRIDIALISETHLTNRTKIHIPDYTILRSNHPDGTAHGGAAIIIRSTILFYNVCQLSEPHIQSFTIQITLDHSPISISAAYCPPNQIISAILFEQFFNSLGNYFIVGGDLNAKHTQWGCHSNSPRGNSLRQVITAKNYLIISPQDPTYWPTSPRKRPDILDIFVSKIPNRFNTIIDNLTNPHSDHSPVLLTLDTSPLKRSMNPSLINGIVNWEKFQSILSNDINLNVSLKSPNQLEESVQYLTSTIQNAAWSSCKPNITNNYHQNNSSLPTYLRSLIVQKRRARATWQRTKYPTDKTKYNHLCTLLKRQMAKQRSEDFAKQTSLLSEKDGSLWKTTRKILKIKTMSFPIKKPDGSLAINDKEKAEAHRHHLSQVFNPNDSTMPSIENKILNSLDSPLPMTLPPKPFTPNAVKSFIQKFPLGKSPGHDLITAEIARRLPNKAILHITHIFNAILRLSYFPIQWKLATIILFPKPNKPIDNPSSYRPISLLPFFAKLLEKLILNRIYPIIKEKNLIPDTQFGFREHHSTIHQTHRLADTIAYSLEKKLYTSAVFLDVAQAFDKVWHPGLLFKLKSFLPPSYYLFFKSYLNERHFFVRSGTEYSSISPILAGVPQGAVVSPTLFNLYSADQPTNPNIQIAEYADDKAIYATHTDPDIVSSILQSHLNDLSHWYSHWRVKINENKSVHTTFALRHRQPPPVHINSKPIPNSDTAKYLGLTFDKRLTWAKHIHTTKLKLNQRLYSLRPILGKFSKLSIKTKIHIYNLLLKPIWLYGIQIWGTAKISNTKKIQVFQSKILRLITNAPPYISNHTLHTDLHIPKVTDTAKLYYSKFRNRLKNHPNPHIKKLLSTSIPGNPPRRLKRQWPRDLIK